MRVNLRGRTPSKRMVFFKWLCYLIFAVLSFVIMTTGNGVRPLLLIPLSISISVREEEVQSAGAAAVCGLLIDMACDIVFGINAILMVIFCVASSMLFGFLLRQNLINVIIITAAVSLLQGLFDFLFSHVIWEWSGSGIIFVNYLLPQMIYTVIAAVPIYYIVMVTADIFGVREKSRLEEKSEDIVRE